MKKTKVKIIDSSLKWSLGLCALVSILTTIGIIGTLSSETWGFFKQVPIFDFLFGTEWTPLLEPKSFGVLPLVLGTLQVTVGAIILALPVGLATAVYLSEYASSRKKQILKPVLEILAGIPTIVYGFFALTFITPVLKLVFPSIQVFNALSGAIVVGVMILPMIASLCDDAFRSVPKNIKEAAYGLGGTSLEVITQVMIPSTASRILAACILAVSRAIGETMAVTLAAGASPNFSINPLESIQTMTSYIVQVALGDTPAGGIEYMTSFAIASLLFVMTFALNAVGQTILYRFKR